MSRVGWVDAGAGVAGDMLLGALADLGALDDLPTALASLPGLSVSLGFDVVRRNGQRATAATVTVGEGEQPERRLADVVDLIAAADVDAAVRGRAEATFRRLAVAEARVHGIAVDEVHFHEVGAADAIVDVLGCCLGLHALGIESLAVSPIALGGGTAETRHGTIPIPGPAVLQLLADSSLIGAGGPGEVELATPTGVALLAEWADMTGPMPEMTVSGIGVGAGSRELPGRPNVVRLAVGETVSPAVDSDEWLVLSANVDDLDPRVWPSVLDGLLAAGAADAWLTPILMKKGRPAQTVSALVDGAVLPAVTDALLRESSTIGVRWHRVGKRALDREIREITIAGCRIGVKLASIDGRIVTATPEWEDVKAAAAATGRPARQLLAEASAAATALLTPILPT